MTLYIGTHSQYANNTVTVVPAHITILAEEWAQLKASFVDIFSSSPLLFDYGANR